MMHEIARVLNRREVWVRVHYDILAERVLLLHYHTIHPDGLNVCIRRFGDLVNESGIFHRLPTRNAELRAQCMMSHH
jgi:hypothetical protein